MKDLALGADELPKKRDVIESAEMQRAQAEAQAGFVIAYKNPRDETLARVNLEKSLERLAFAETAYYSYPRGGKDIFGPSINLAREFARTWKNILHGDRVVHDTNEERTIEGYAWDLQANTHIRAQESFKKLIQRRDKKTKITKWVVPDERDLRELTRKHAAILKRNCILELAPRDMINALVAKAREVVKKGIKKIDIKQIRVDMVKAFETLGVYGTKLNPFCETNYGHTIDKITPDEITELRGIWNAIKEGNTSIDEYFSPTAPAKKEEPGEIKIEDIEKKWLEKNPELPASPTPQQQEIDESKLSEEERKAFDALRQHQLDILVIMLQRHRHDKNLDYAAVLNTTLLFNTDKVGKIKYLTEQLGGIGIDVDKEFKEIEKEHSPKKS